MSQKQTSGFMETVMTVIYAVLIALVIRTVAYEPFNIPSGSMKPTLLVGDYLFVSKFSYGYSRHSLPFSLPLIPGRILFSEPQRGDVAVFKLPSNPKVDYIKRVIGLPGDRIQVVQGLLHINGQPVRREPAGIYVLHDDTTGATRPVNRYIETLPNGKQHPIIEADGDFGPADNTRVFVVPKDHYFMMGDNRDNSTDSRFAHVGFVPKENFVGRAEFLFFSVEGSAWEIWKWFDTVRVGRLFTGIE
ncbi:MAG: signal peptidase I [Hyphomicrobiales bacterium]|nr:signal peptidase I [Hyphomicrobiales bacterium]